MKKILLAMVILIVISYGCCAGYQYYTTHRVLHPVMFRCENIIKETMKNPSSYELISATMMDNDDEPYVIIEFYGENSRGAKTRSVAGFDFILDDLCKSHLDLLKLRQFQAEARLGITIVEQSTLQSVTIDNKIYMGRELKPLSIVSYDKKQLVPYKGKEFPRTFSKSELTVTDGGICEYSYEMSPKNYAILRYAPSKFFPYE